eukprot:CAMPEP_0201493174 /NCGR_PEP_ID=MMETSP0151_2-20130828/36257_1 /ASSEMBLY_ACC=CAM_ASM_000257 /TAXON_ID=200890 /ORGANISM="Paramoeba atlantica, Strain 621/1 / CCAP 1560/9" /LENGTH=141 /DNA_ID=CAMNT_0047880371 /DNA_START=49 /DNA_END=474 /DNA_ORIENTATION=-
MFRQLFRPSILLNNTSSFRASSLGFSGRNYATVNITFITADGKEIPVAGKEGENILITAHQNGVDLEGACECSLACSTCHVILEEEMYNKLDEPADEEYDMLDLAFSPTETSRLGCQVDLSPELEGARIQLPAGTRNMQVG